MSHKFESLIFDDVTKRISATTKNEHIANYLAMELLKAQRLANEMAYQQLRIANSTGVRVVSEKTMADFNERLG